MITINITVYYDEVPENNFPENNLPECHRICADPDLMDDREVARKLREDRVDEIRNCPFRKIYNCKFEKDLYKWF